MVVGKSFDAFGLEAFAHKHQSECHPGVWHLLQQLSARHDNCLLDSSELWQSLWSHIG